MSFRSIVLLTSFAALAGAQGLKNPFFVFDNGTGRDNKLPLEEQAELVKRTGFAGLGYTGAKRVPEMLQALESRGLKLTSIYVSAWIDGDKPRYDPDLPQAIKQLKGHGTVIWMIIRGHAPDADQRTAAIVREVADMAAASGLRVVLYPHIGHHAPCPSCDFYVSRIEDALRIRKLVDRPNVGVTFNMAHFLAIGDEPNLDQRLKEALPYLEMVSINGAEHEGGWDRLIQPLDRGAFDVYGLVKKLVLMGYKGPIGLQCYQVPGDMEQNLNRSMAAWRTFSARMAAGK